MIIYKCDICKTTAVAKDHGVVPKGWEFVTPAHWKGELCPACSEARKEIIEEERERYLYRVDKRLRQYTPEAQLDEQ